jgi:PEGA domain
VDRPPVSGVYPPIYGNGGYYPYYYPWGWGGLAFGGYYGGYYDPWLDPGSYSTTYSSYGYEGRLRIKVKPEQAAVYVDGYYAGEVDEFDGVFQRLHLDSGPHRIEITLNGYEPLNFDVRIQPDKTVTYKGEMKRLPE